jgi:hypothetical protein
MFAVAVHESIDDGRVDDALASGDTRQGVDDDLDVVDAVLEQVAQVFGFLRTEDLAIVTVVCAYAVSIVEAIGASN